MSHNLQDYRKSYEKGNLSEDSVEKDPLKQFKSWFQNAKDSNTLDEVNTMTLTTVGVDGFPKGRIVLLKEFGTEGFTFYTNYNSDKGIAIAHSNKVSISFFWPALEQQVIIQGIAQKTTDENSTQYFHSRPKGSQLGATVSQQSHPVANREVLENQLKQLEVAYKNKEVPRPKNWGGYVIKPVAFEFWQGRPNRLHDRIHYTLENEKWVITRLQP